MDWTDNPYRMDVFPSHWSPETKAYFKDKYRYIPEKFYSRTRLPVVTPDNVEKFISTHASIAGLRFQFQEQMSGSGLLSTEAYYQGLAVLFPVDCSYGRDMNHEPHLVLLKKVRHLFQPIFKWSSPISRSNFSPASSSSPPWHMEFTCLRVDNVIQVRRI